MNSHRDALLRRRATPKTPRNDGGDSLRIARHPAWRIDQCLGAGLVRCESFGPETERRRNLPRPWQRLIDGEGFSHLLAGIDWPARLTTAPYPGVGKSADTARKCVRYVCCMVAHARPARAGVKLWPKLHGKRSRQDRKNEHNVHPACTVFAAPWSFVFCRLLACRLAVSGLRLRLIMRSKKQTASWGS